MRHLVLALLVAVPVALCGWIAWRGRTAAPPEPAAAGATAPASAPAQDADAALRRLLEAPLAGARVKERVVLYDAKGLFDYIDGAAPIYLERHFRRLAAAEMATADGGELTCDVYDMDAAANAESIFAKERSPAARPVPAWPDAVSGQKAFVFHHGRYYAKLTAFDERAEAALEAIGRALKERMR